MIGVSITVHEQPLVLENQIANIKKYLKDCVIIIHINKLFRSKFEEEYKSLNLSFIDDKTVFLNPESNDTTNGPLLKAIVSNYNYLKSKCSFDYYLTIASNEMFIKPGANEYIEQYKSASMGFDVEAYCKHIREKGGCEWLGGAFRGDSSLYGIMRKYNLKTIYGSQHEGAFFETSKLDKVINILNAEYNYNTIVYAKEEVVIHTLYYNFYPEEYLRRCHPLTFINYEVMTVEQLEKLRTDTTYHNKYDNIPRGNYSVKRVNRRIDDPLRQYINNLA